MSHLDATRILCAASYHILDRSTSQGKFSYFLGCSVLAAVHLTRRFVVFRNRNLGFCLVRAFPETAYIYGWPRRDSSTLVLDLNDSGFVIANPYGVSLLSMQIP